MTETVSPPFDSANARPQVARTVNDRSVWLFTGITVIAAALLFGTLEARRAAKVDSSLIRSTVQSSAIIEPPPPLAIPEASPAATTIPADTAAWPGSYTQLVPAPGSVFQRSEQRQGRNSQRFSASSLRPAYALNPPALPAGPALVYTAPAASPMELPDGIAQGASLRVHASRFKDPATTIPQGSVIQAVLETALDSTRAGPARAIVSRDVRGFEGTKVLIPRGSRLYGEYKSDVSNGQNRAMIQWTRLMRPDGVVISLDSPSADPLGRAGVEGKVNSHFFSRFGSALLQTSLNLGVGFATRNVGGGTVILGLPGSTQTIAPTGDSVKPTLKVAQGTAVSVFVARDLDFTEVEQ